MDKEHTTHITARFLVLGYVLIAISTAVLILAATPTRSSAIEAPQESLLDTSNEEALQPDTRLVLNDGPNTHTVPYWCGVNGGVKFNTGAVGTHTQSPIETVISVGPPTAVTSVTPLNDSTIPYKIVVNGGSINSATYTWPATVSNMTAPIVNDADPTPNVSYVIVCYLEKKNTDDPQSDPVDNGSPTDTDDSDQGDVLGISTEANDNDVLGAETLANTGLPGYVTVGVGFVIAIASVGLYCGSKTHYKL